LTAFDRVTRDQDPLALLPEASNAVFNAAGKEDEPVCLIGTRVGVLDEIRAWIDGEDKQHIFWLSGWAGTGKSTIARTVAREYYDRKRLVASYFFSRGGGDAGNATKFVGTIARQLANKFPKFKEQLRKALSEDEGILRRVLKDQWRELIITPLVHLTVDSCPSPVVIVVDALDECDTESSIRQVIQLLADTKNLNQLLRILITSRPEVPVRDEFSRFLLGEHHLILQDISKFIVEQDISLFLKHHLATISPEDEVVAQLVQKAAGLFIWAATACRFICEGPSPEKRLRIILKSSGSTPTLNYHINGNYVSLFQNIIRSLIWNTSYLWFWIAVACGFSHEGVMVKRSLRTLVMGNTTPDDHLDVIYLTVLDSSLRSSFTPQDIRDFHSMVRDVLGSIVVLFSSLSVKSLSNLLSKPEKDLTWTMNDLHALLDIPKNAKHAVRLHHPSFRDFLLNKKRCCDSYFWVDEKQAHQALFDSCLRLLSTSLKQDICEVNAPGMLAAKLESGRVEQFLPPEVQYACLYWIQHVQKSGAQLRDNGQVHQFLQEHLLHWLEALGWIVKVPEGVHAITSLESFVSVSIPPAREKVSANSSASQVNALFFRVSSTTRSGSFSTTG
jgi:hypothetical protein